MNRHLLHMMLVLGLITAVGPFATDMYLPALPSIGHSLRASPALVQMSLTAFFVGIGLCQLVYGPLADMFGRKRPIYFGLTVFIIASIGCALAPTVEILIGFRVIQAFGACAGMVIPRAMVRDMHTGPEATRLMSLLMLVTSVSPILAPLTGSLIIAAFGWRGVFWALVVAAGMALVLAATQIKETASERQVRSWRTVASSYGRLASDPSFMSLALVAAFGLSSFFVYVSNSSFVLINHFGLNSTQFSLCFSLNAASFVGCAQLTGRLTERYGLANVLRVAVSGFAGTMILMAVTFALGLDSLPAMMAFQFVGYGLLGLVMPTTAVLALSEHGAVAGTASALLGATQWVTGAVLMAIFGLFANGRPLPMTIGIAGCATAAFVVAQIALASRRQKVMVEAQ